MLLFVSRVMRTQRLRRLAVHVLLAWLFALTTGIVNACVIKSELPDSGHSESHIHAAVATEAEVQDLGGHLHESDHANPPCERFCDEPSVISPAVKQQSDFDTSYWPAPGPVSSFGFQALSGPNGAIHSKSVCWRASIPISIAFLRLTL